MIRIRHIFLKASAAGSLWMKDESVNRRYYGTAVYCL